LDVERTSFLGIVPDDSVCSREYQSIPPYYLNDRFTASTGDATRRLYYLTSNLNLSGTPMEDWKIAIASATTNAGR